MTHCAHKYCHKLLGPTLFGAGFVTGVGLSTLAALKTSSHVVNVDVDDDNQHGDVAIKLSIDNEGNLRIDQFD